MPDQRPTLEFGLCGLTAQTLDGTAAAWHEQAEILIAACRTADDGGLGSVWLSEHHFVDDGYLPSPFPMLAAVAVRTTRVQLSTNVAIGALYDPLRLAEDCAVIDHLSAGRLMVGLGLGYRDGEFSALGVRRADRAPRVEQCVRLMRRAWAGDAVAGPASLDGAAVRVTPPPFRDGGPPILLGALAEPGVRRAARLADGWIAPSFAQPRHLRQRLHWLNEAGAFERPFRVALTFNGFVAARDAWEVVRPGAVHVADQYRRWMTDSGDVRSLRGAQDDPGAPSDGRPPHFVAGNPQECAAQLRPWCDAVSDLPATVTVHVNIRLTFPGVASAQQLEAIRLFATETVPALVR